MPLHSQSVRWSDKSHYHYLLTKSSSNIARHTVPGVHHTYSNVEINFYHIDSKYQRYYKIQIFIFSKQNTNLNRFCLLELFSPYIEFLLDLKFLRLCQATYLKNGFLVCFAYSECSTSQSTQVHISPCVSKFLVFCGLGWHIDIVLWCISCQCCADVLIFAFYQDYSF